MNDGENQLNYETPQKTAQKLIYSDPENDKMQTQHLYQISENNQQYLNQGSHQNEERNSHQCIISNSSERKSEMRVETENPAYNEEFKVTSAPLQEGNQSMSHRNINMIDYLLNTDRMIPARQIKEKEEGAVIDEEEDEKMNSSNPFGNNPNFNHKIVDNNLLGINDDQGYNSWQYQDSNAKSTLRNSFPSYVDESIETKEGWLLKKSYSAPSVIGWQKRYVEIKNQKLLYYKTKDKRFLDGVIDFNLLTCLISVPKNATDENVSGKFY